MWFDPPSDSRLREGSVRVNIPLASTGKKYQYALGLADESIALIIASSLSFNQSEKLIFRSSG